MADLNAIAQSELDMLDINAQAEEMRQAMPKKIGEKEITKAIQILEKYQKGKAKLENKIIQEEDFWKLAQWSQRHDKDKEDSDYQPATAWLWSCIQSRHSDAMDSYPTCNFLARQQDDKAEAKLLSSVVPVILEQNRYEETYSDVVWYLLKHGGVPQGIFWNKKKNNGLGDIEIKQMDFLNMAWEPGVKDIQDSANVFVTELVSRDRLNQQYPQTIGKLKSKNITVKKYNTDDQIDDSNKSVVVDWYYKIEVNGKTQVHLVKFVDNIVLYATENDTEIPTDTVVDPATGIPMIVPIPGARPTAETGLYDHGLYPFVVQQLYPIEGSLCGYGLIDIARDGQMQIDELNKAVTDNAVWTAAPQYFERDGAGLNDADFLDHRKPLKKVNGDISQNLVPIETAPMSGICVDVLQSKIEEVKYVTSNQDVSNGVAPSGVTAASAIAALQETQGKNSRATNKALYRCYRDVIYQVLELIRQFYTAPRTYRIAPDDTQTEEQYTVFSNEGLRPKQQIVQNHNYGLRNPEFDIEVSTEKESPYKKMEQNELALNFYSLGFFDPMNADKALACLQMMDFSHKEEVMALIQRNGTIQQMLLQYQQIALQLAQRTGDPALVEQLSQAVLQSAGQAAPAGMSAIPAQGGQEHPFVEKSREQARESTQVE